FVLFSLAKSSTKITGDMLEVGVYKGGSAKLICAVKGAKSLYLFDTFEGLKDAKEVDKESDNTFVNGDFNSDYSAVKELFSKEVNVSVYKGYFPKDAENMTDKRFCFVNLDVDTHESTVNSLNFIYSKMNRGGFILSHDYPTAKGVKTAIDEFFKDKPESIIQVSNKQCLIVKL
ncbi:MAG: TylF/MycF/NovP-related O-methyltransferase, partial [Nanoarchaeota archaeon]